VHITPGWTEFIQSLGGRQARFVIAHTPLPHVARQARQVGGEQTAFFATVQRRWSPQPTGLQTPRLQWLMRSWRWPFVVAGASPTATGGFVPPHPGGALPGLQRQNAPIPAGRTARPLSQLARLHGAPALAPGLLSRQLVQRYAAGPPRPPQAPARRRLEAGPGAERPRGVDFPPGELPGSHSSAPLALLAAGYAGSQAGAGRRSDPDLPIPAGRTARPLSQLARLHGAPALAPGLLSRQLVQRYAAGPPRPPQAPARRRLEAGPHRGPLAGPVGLGPRGANFLFGEPSGGHIFAPPATRMAGPVLPRAGATLPVMQRQSASSSVPQPDRGSPPAGLATPVVQRYPVLGVPWPTGTDIPERRLSAPSLEQPFILPPDGLAPSTSSGWGNGYTPLPLVAPVVTAPAPVVQARMAPQADPTTAPLASALSTPVPQHTRASISPQSQGQDAIEMEDVVDQVWRQLMRRLAVEGERRGGRQWP